MKLKELILVSSNSAKAGEVERILNIPVRTVPLEIDEIQGRDLEKIALHKLNKAFKLVKKPVIIDDVSFEINAWNGFPGPLIKWLLEEKNDPSLMLRMLGDEKNRRAIARLAVGFHDGNKPHIFIGEVKGKVSHNNRGENGFGWDKVFIPQGYDQTFAQMPPKLKDSISHRGKALAKLKDFIKTNYEL